MYLSEEGNISIPPIRERYGHNAIRKIQHQHGNGTGVGPAPTEPTGGRRAGVRASCNLLCVSDALTAGTVPRGGLRNVRHIRERTPLNTVEGIFTIRFICRKGHAGTGVSFGCVYSAYDVFRFKFFGRL